MSDDQKNDAEEKPWEWTPARREIAKVLKELGPEFTAALLKELGDEEPEKEETP